MRSGWDWTSPQITTLPNCFPCPFLLFLLPSPEILSSINTTQKSFGQTLLLAKVAPDNCHEVVSPFSLGLQTQLNCTICPWVQSHPVEACLDPFLRSWKYWTRRSIWNCILHNAPLMKFLGLFRKISCSLPSTRHVRVIYPSSINNSNTHEHKGQSRKDHKQGKNQAQLSISRLIVLGLGM